MRTCASVFVCVYVCVLVGEERGERASKSVCFHCRVVLKLLAKWWWGMVIGYKRRNCLQGRVVNQFFFSPD